MEILRNIARHKLRSTLTITGIVIGVLALTTMGALAENFNALIDGGVKYFGSNVQVGPPDGQSTFLLPLSKIDAGDPDENNWTPFKITTANGQMLTSSSIGEVVLGSTLSREFKKTVGDTIDLPVKPTDAKPDFVNHTFKVVGILNKTLTAPDTFAYISIADGQSLLKDSLPAPLQSALDVSQITEGITVYGKPGTPLTELDKIANRINSQVPSVKATRPTQLVTAFQSGGAIFTGITTAAALLALIIGGLSVVNTMFMAVAERVREIGLKKAVGATTLNVMGEFLIEATLIGVIGGFVGYGLGAGIVLAKNLTTPPDQSTLFLLTPTLTIFAIGFATVLGAVAGVLPAWRAARLDPVTALRNE